MRSRQRATHSFVDRRDGSETECSKRASAVTCHSIVNVESTSLPRVDPDPSGAPTRFRRIQASAVSSRSTRRGLGLLTLPSGSASVLHGSAQLSREAASHRR